jgi:hypothetical protein
MTDGEAVPPKPDRSRMDKVPLVDAATADELLAKAQAEGVELLGPDGLLSQVTKAVLERALDEELTATWVMRSMIRLVAGRAIPVTATVARRC